MNAFAAATDALFADPNLGETALWQAGGIGPGVPVRVIRRRPDAVVEFELNVGGDFALGIADGISRACFQLLE